MQVLGSLSVKLSINCFMFEGLVFMSQQLFCFLSPCIIVLNYTLTALLICGYIFVLLSTRYFFVEVLLSCSLIVVENQVLVFCVEEKWNLGC